MKETVPAVKALIERDGKLLVLKAGGEQQEYWVLPGGKIEYGEEPEEALRRELLEELSCDADIGDTAGMYYFFTGPDDDGEQVVLTVFRTEIHGEVDISKNPADEDIRDYFWLTPREFIEKSDNESLKQLIKEEFL